MCYKTQKKWTILIYADGNNEMEEVIYNSFQDCKRATTAKNINVVIQIGKLGNYEAEESEIWKGIRRYYIEDGNSQLLMDLGNANLADPRTLYDFLIWGLKYYKSQNYMVVLSGHGGDFVGCFSDMSQEKPYLMGVPEMIKTINLAKRNTGSDIDIVLFDMCFMNTVEVLYELGQDEASSARSVITYLDYAAFEGLDYKCLIETASLYGYEVDLNSFIKHLIDRQKYNLIAYKIDYSSLQNIKALFNSLAYESNVHPWLLNNFSNETKELILLKNINDKLETLVIYSKKSFLGVNYSIGITSKELGTLIFFYNKLAFSKNNKWGELLSTSPKSISEENQTRVKVALSSTSVPIVHHILEFK